MEKLCNKCKEIKDVNEFYMDKSTKDGYRSYCKNCISKNSKKRHLKNKEYNNKHSLEKYYCNREYSIKRNKLWKDANKNKVKEYEKQKYKNNKEQILQKNKEYRKNNKEKIKLYNKKRNNSYAKFDLFAHQLTIEESAKLSFNGVSLEVKCRYCGKYFKPTTSQVEHRINSIKSIGSERSLYCSEECKYSCPIYYKSKYPKGFKKSSSREVNPLVRQMCFKRDDWTCQVCGATQKIAPLHCHHIEGYAQNPRLGNDVTNTITLCKTCHKEVHKLPGCGYTGLRCDE